MEPIRQCGECSVCCKVTQVEGTDFTKLPGVTCPLLSHKDGKAICARYGQDNRPDCCDQFRCGWLRGFGSETDRPDQCGVMLSINSFNGGPWIFAIETKKNALRTSGKSIVIDMTRKYNLPVIVVDHKSNFPNDKGDYIVIKNSLLPRTKKIKGKLLWKLAEDIGVYKLIITP